jgi:hypothetical protein
LYRCTAAAAAAAKTRHDQLVAEDAKLEKSARREFGDDDDFGETLLRVLRNRTRPPTSGHQGGQGGGGGGGGGGRGGSARRGSVSGRNLPSPGGRKSPASLGRKSPTQHGGAGGRSPSPEVASASAAAAADSAPAEVSSPPPVVVVNLDPFAVDLASAATAASAAPATLATTAGGASGAVGVAPRFVKASGAPPVFTEPPYHAEDMPEGLNPEVWTRVLAARDAKMTREEALRAGAEALGSANAAAAAADTERRAGATRVAALERRRDALAGNAAAELLDLEMSVTMRQGRVEGKPSATADADAADAAAADDGDAAPLLDDFSDSVFLHRQLVEALNAEVRSAGGDKVDMLRRQASGRLDIYKLQWEQRRDEMLQADLSQKIQVIHSLKVTRHMGEQISQQQDAVDTGSGAGSADGGAVNNKKAEEERLIAALQTQRRAHAAKMAQRDREERSLDAQLSSRCAENAVLLERTAAAAELLERRTLEAGRNGGGGRGGGGGGGGDERGAGPASPVRGGRDSSVAMEIAHRRPGTASRRGTASMVRGSAMRSSTPLSVGGVGGGGGGGGGDGGGGRGARAGLGGSARGPSGRGGTPTPRAAYVPAPPATQRSQSARYPRPGSGSGSAAAGSGGGGANAAVVAGINVGAGAAAVAMKGNSGLGVGRVRPSTARPGPGRGRAALDDSAQRAAAATSAEMGGSGGGSYPSYPADDDNEYTVEDEPFGWGDELAGTGGGGSITGATPGGGGAAAAAAARARRGQSASAAARDPAASRLRAMRTNQKLQDISEVGRLYSC